MNFKETMTLFEWIGAARHAVGWKSEAEWPTMSIGFHCIRTLEKDLFVF